MNRAELEAIQPGDSVLGCIFGEPDECAVVDVGAGYEANNRFVRFVRLRRGDFALPMTLIEGNDEMLAVRI